MNKVCEIAKRPPLRTFDDACTAESAGAFVYNVLDEYGQCIYIGATRDVPRRMREHSSRARWWPLAASVDVFPMIDWHQALHVERGMLKQINPPFNQQCVDRTESNVNAAKTGLFRWIMGVAQ